MFFAKSEPYLNQNLLAEALKNKFLSPSFFFQLTRSSLHQTTKEFLAFIKPTLHVFVISVTFALFNVD